MDAKEKLGAPIVVCWKEARVSCLAQGQINGTEL